MEAMGHRPAGFLFAAAIVMATSLVHPGPAKAAVCGAGLDTSDFTFRGTDANACHGPVSGNPNSLGDFNTALGAVAGIGGGWEVFLSSGPGGSASVDWHGFNFTFLPEAVLGPSPASGNYWLFVTDLSPGTPPEYPISFDFLLAPKAGNQWASYVFDDETFAMDDSGKIAWRITFNNNNSPGAPAAGLSHMNFLLRDFVGSDCEAGCTPPEEVPCEQGCDIPTQSVPEPGTLASLLLGIAGLAGLRRRRG